MRALPDTRRYSRLGSLRYVRSSTSAGISSSRPRLAAARAQPLAQHVLELEKIPHVVDEVLHLLGRERARAPVADGLRLAQRHAAQVAHEVEQRDRQAVADERGGDLRVEHLARQRLERVGEDAQIGRERVADDARLRQRVDERAQVAQRERVDERDAVVEQQLHDHEVRRVRLLGVELGVERDARRAQDTLAQRAERLGRVDERDGPDRAGRAHGRTRGMGSAAGLAWR